MEANVTTLDDQMRQHLAALAASQMRLAKLWNEVILPMESCQVEANSARCSGPLDTGHQRESTDSVAKGKSPRNVQLPSPPLPVRPGAVNEIEDDERTHRALSEWGIPVAKQPNATRVSVAKSGRSELLADMPSSQQRQGPRLQTGTPGAARSVRGQENSPACPPLMDMLRTALISQRTTQAAAMDQAHADLLARGRGREACGKGGNAQSGHATSPWTAAKAGGSEDSRSGHRHEEARSASATLGQGDQHGLRMQVQDLQLQLQTWHLHETRLRAELDEQRQTQLDNNMHRDGPVEERLLPDYHVHEQQQRRQQRQQQSKGQGLGPQPPIPSRLLHPEASDIAPTGRQPSSAWLEGGFRNALGGYGPIKYQ